MAMAPRREHGIGVDIGAEFGDETALADARHADDRHELQAAFGATVLERVDQQPQFPTATDEGCPVARWDRYERTWFYRDPARNGFGLALRVDRFVGLEHDLAFRRPERHLTHQHPIDRRGRLQARRG